MLEISTPRCLGLQFWYNTGIIFASGASERDRFGVLECPCVERASRESASCCAGRRVAADGDASAVEGCVGRGVGFRRGSGSVGGWDGIVLEADDAADVLMGSVVAVEAGSLRFFVFGESMSPLPVA